MATIAVHTADEFALAVKSARANDILKLAPGLIIPEMYLPNVMADPKTPITITSESWDEQAIFRGLALHDSVTKGNFARLGAHPGAVYRGLVFDMVTFEAKKYKAIKQPDGSTVMLKKAVGWRVPWGSGVNSMGDQAGMIGLQLSPAVNGLLVRNCLFDGYAKCVKMNGPSNVVVEYCDFLRNCEDMIMLWSGANITLRYNRQGEFDGLDYDDSRRAFGWDLDKNSGVPVHADFIQGAGPIKGYLKIIGNVMNDITGRVHGILLNAPSGGRPYENVEISDNRFDMTHTTAIYGGNANGLTMQRNKIVRVRELPSPPNPKGKNDTKVELLNLAGKVTIATNECRKFNLADVSGTIANNTETNETEAGYRGYVELREDEREEPADLFAGVWGEAGVIPPETEKPPIEPPVEPPTGPDIDLPPQPLPPLGQRPEPEHPIVLPPVDPDVPKPPEITIDSVVLDGPDIVITIRIEGDKPAAG